MKDYLIKLPEELHTKLKLFSYSKGVTMSNFIREAIKEKLDKEEK